MKQIRRLEKDIEKVRGLKFLSPVEAHVIPRGKGDAPVPGVERAAASTAQDKWFARAGENIGKQLIRIG